MTQFGNEEWKQLGRDANQIDMEIGILMCGFCGGARGEFVTEKQCELESWVSVVNFVPLHSTGFYGSCCCGTRSWKQGDKEGKGILVPICLSKGVFDLRKHHELEDEWRALSVRASDSLIGTNGQETT